MVSAARRESLLRWSAFVLGLLFGIAIGGLLPCALS